MEMIPDATALKIRAKRLSISFFETKRLKINRQTL